MKKVKFTVEMPSGNYCGDCPCLGLNGVEEERCGFFNVSLDIKSNGRVEKCGECKSMTKMLLNELK
jgi:hypothetical protein